jgi:hypothetical protein
MIRAGLAGVVLAAAAIPAGAVTVVGATTIRIENALDTWIQVAEVQAVSFANVNVALAGTATASSVYEVGVSDPERANDGITAGNYSDPSQRIFHSLSGAGQYLQVAIAPTTLKSLTVWGRSDCCRARDLFDVWVYNAGGETLWSGTLDIRSGDQFRTVTFEAPPSDGIPEPASWAMLITGFGLVGSVVRRRRAAPRREALPVRA